MSLAERKFGSELPVQVFIRPEGSEDEWQELDTGPGYFTIPAGHEAKVQLRAGSDQDLAQLVEELEDVPEVTALDLSENRNLTTTGLAKLKQLPWLTWLNLSACGISDRGLSDLAGLSRLRHLDLSYCNRLTDQNLKALARLRSLEYLDLQGCVKITRAGVAHLDRHGLTVHKPSRGEKMRPGSGR
ncbi:MAG TPA: hypothetical protein GYA06_13400 [Chloroflexi bacterium]|nr:hypothetical protein [Chloroflexota bacterium]